MSSSSDSSSSSSGSEAEKSFDGDIVEFSRIVPYDEDLEPSATPEEAAEHEARMAEEAEIDRQYQARFTREVELAKWYDISTCFFIKFMILMHFYSNNSLLSKYLPTA